MIEKRPYDTFIFSVVDNLITYVFRKRLHGLEVRRDNKKIKPYPFRKLKVTEVIKEWNLSLNDEDMYPLLWKESKRYKTKFNALSLYIPWENLDIKHKIFNLRYATYYKYFYSNFKKEYETEFKDYLKEKLWARQFVVYFFINHNKFKDLYEDLRFKWIFDETPYIYLYNCKRKEYITRKQLIDNHKDDNESMIFNNILNNFCNKNAPISINDNNSYYDFSIKNGNIVHKYNKRCPYLKKSDLLCNLKSNCLKRVQVKRNFTHMFGLKINKDELYKLVTNQPYIVAFPTDTHGLSAFFNNNQGKYHLSTYQQIQMFIHNNSNRIASVKVSKDMLKIISDRVFDTQKARISININHHDHWKEEIIKVVNLLQQNISNKNTKQNQEFKLELEKLMIMVL